MVDSLPVELTYSDVEATLAGLNRIADEKRVAFRARLKHFQRLGFPEGANTGTGRRVIYSVPMLFKLALATELTQAGMSPKRIVEILTHNWGTCEPSILFALTPDGFKDQWSPPLKDNHLVLILSPESLRDLTEDGEGKFDYHESVDVRPLSELSDFLRSFQDAPIVGESYRHLIIELRPFAQRVVWHLAEIRDDVGPVEIWNDLQSTLAIEGERLKNLLKDIDSIRSEKLDGNP